MHYARCLKIQENKKGGINENKVYTGNINNPLIYKKK
jgi:hypothetical protein